MVTGFTFLSRLTQIATPHTRFVFLGAGIRLGLPSHPASRRRSCLRLGVSTTSSSRGLSPPSDRPCRAYSRRRRYAAPLARRQRRAQPPKARTAHAGPRRKDSPDQHSSLVTQAGYVLLAAHSSVRPRSQQLDARVSARNALGYAGGSAICPVPRALCPVPDDGAPPRSDTDRPPDYATWSGKARVTAAVRLETWSLP
jgi:hypothetical protein